MITWLGLHWLLLLVIAIVMAAAGMVLFILGEDAGKFAGAALVTLSNIPAFGFIVGLVIAIIDHFIH